MSTPYIINLDELGMYGGVWSTTNAFGRWEKRSMAKQIHIQERWDARCQKRRLRQAVNKSTVSKTKKI